MYVCWKTITMWLTLQYIVKESTLRISHDNSFVFHATFRSFTVNKSSTGVASHIPIGSHPTKKRIENSWGRQMEIGDRTSPIETSICNAHAQKSPRIWSNVAALWCTSQVQCLWMLFRQQRFGGWIDSAIAALSSVGKNSDSELPTIQKLRPRNKCDYRQVFPNGKNNDGDHHDDDKNDNSDNHSDSHYPSRSKTKLCLVFY